MRAKGHRIGCYLKDECVDGFAHVMIDGNTYGSHADTDPRSPPDTPSRCPRSTPLRLWSTSVSLGMDVDAPSVGYRDLGYA